MMASATSAFRKSTLSTHQDEEVMIMSVFSENKVKKKATDQNLEINGKAKAI